MNHKASIFVIVSLFVFLDNMQSQQSVPDGIFAALKVGNSKELAKFFNENIELVILEKEGVYSKTQADIILREFFTNNIPNSYIKLHEGGGKDASKYIIGRLSTSKGQYRIVFLMKTSKGIFCIHQFRIEDDN